MAKEIAQKAAGGRAASAVVDVSAAIARRAFAASASGLVVAAAASWDVSAYEQFRLRVRLALFVEVA